MAENLKCTWKSAISDFSMKYGSVYGMHGKVSLCVQRLLTAQYNLKINFPHMVWSESSFFNFISKCLKENLYYAPNIIRMIK
jgi:hypothetical protein